MSETIQAERGRSGALSSMRLPELQALAAEIGLPGAAGMRKPELVAAIREHRGGKAPARSASPRPARSRQTRRRERSAEGRDDGAAERRENGAAGEPRRGRGLPRERAGARRDARHRAAGPQRCAALR